MLQHLLVIVPSLGVLAVAGLLTDLPHRLLERAQPAKTAAAAFVPQPIRVSARIHGLGERPSAEQLLDRALERLAPESLPWLATKIWQRSTHADLPYEMTGTVELGPNQCARVDLRMQVGSAKRRRVRVSDGVVLASADLGFEPSEAVSTYHLPQAAPAERLRWLAEQGCSNPWAMLSKLRQRLEGAKVRTGLLDETAVFVVTGEVAAEEELRRMALYLDANTLWPLRVEWRKERGSAVEREVEYREPRFNVAHTSQECQELFSWPAPSAETQANASPVAAASRLAR